jgi:CheY-like chemotaxis protein
MRSSGFGTGGGTVTSIEKQTFLIVDDEVFSRNMVAQMLKRAGAQDVITVENGAQAMSALNQLPITVMITDFHMPGIHGLQLLKNIRTGQTKAPRNLPCAMLTGHAVRHLVGLAIVLDVDSFLAKPVSSDTLTKHLDRAFQYRFEPMPVEQYAVIDVSHADVFLTGRPPAAAPPPPPSKEEEADEWLDETAPVEPKAKPTTSKKGAGSDEPAPRPKPKARPAPPPSRRPAEDAPARSLMKSPGKPTGEAKRMLLTEVPEGMVLAKNIVGSSGTLLLASGTAFRSRYVRRLQELRDIEGDIEYVWVRPA